MDEFLRRFNLTEEDLELPFTEFVLKMNGGHNTSSSSNLTPTGIWYNPDITAWSDFNITCPADLIQYLMDEEARNIQDQKFDRCYTFDDWEWENGC